MGDLSIRKRRIIRENVTAVLFLLPALLFLGIFMIYPLFYSGFLSFFEWSGVSQKVFVGVKNFITLFHDQYFWRGLVNTVLVALSGIVFQVFPGMIVAYILVRVLKKVKRFYLFLFLVPMVVSEICIGLLWSFIYNPYFGLLNGLLDVLGLEHMATGWLGDPSTAFIAVIIAMNFTYMGLYVLLFVNSIQNVSENLFDAAKIDGAGGIRLFFNIVIPTIRESIGSTALLCVISAFKTFSLVFVLTGGGPNHRTEVLSTYLYKVGFNSFKMGYSAAIGFFQMILTAVAGITVLRAMSRSDSIR